MKKATLVLLVLLAVLVIIVGFGFRIAHDHTKDNGPKKVSLRLAWLHGPGFEGFYAAKDKGFYSQENLDVRLYPGGPDQNPIRSVAAGSDTFGQGGLVEVLQARDKDIPIKAIAAIFRENPVVYFSLRGSGIQSPKDFANKKIGVKYGLDTEIIYRALLSKQGIDPKSVTEFPARFDMTPLFRKEVDVWPGYINYEPIIAKMQGYEVDVIKSGDYDIPMYGQVIFAREDFIKDHPDEVRKFLAATVKGWQYVLDHESEAAEFSKKYSPETDLVLAQQIFSAVKPLVIAKDGRVGYMDQSVWRADTDILREQDLLQHDVKPEDAFTNEFFPQQ